MFALVTTHLPPRRLYHRGKIIRVLETGIYPTGSGWRLRASRAIEIGYLGRNPIGRGMTVDS